MNEDSKDGRPDVAIGHIGLKVRDVADVKQFFVLHGMREVFARDNFAVLELRGGTHLVLQALEDGETAKDICDFDLMVDDIDATYQRYLDDTQKLSEISRGDIHDSFTVTGPSDIQVRITSSHAGDRIV